MVKFVLQILVAWLMACVVNAVIYVAIAPAQPNSILAYGVLVACYFITLSAWPEPKSDEESSA